MQIICHGYSWRDKYVILDHSELGNIDVTMHFDSGADGTAIVDDRIVPDMEIITNSILFPDHDIVAGLQTSADGGARMNDGATTDAGTRADDQRIVANVPTGYIS